MVTMVGSLSVMVTRVTLASKLSEVYEWPGGGGPGRR